MGRMAELYQELKDADYQAELNMLAYEEWVSTELEKEAEAYQMTTTEQNALNTYMEGSHAFYNRNGAVSSSGDVFKLHNRKKRRREMHDSLQAKNKEKVSDNLPGQKGSRSKDNAPW